MCLYYLKICAPLKYANHLNQFSFDKYQWRVYDQHYFKCAALNLAHTCVVQAKRGVCLSVCLSCLCVCMCVCER